MRGGTPSSWHTQHLRDFENECFLGPGYSTLLISPYLLFFLPSLGFLLLPPAQCLQAPLPLQALFHILVFQMLAYVWAAMDF